MPRSLLLAVVLLGACAVDEPPPPDIHVVSDNAALASSFAVNGVFVEGEDDGSDLCDLAAALPRADVCSLVCEPDQFAARLVANGAKSGACYQLRCELSDSVAVSVGVCLP